MARRTRSFLFDNISKRLVQNTNKTAKEINTRRVANTVANTDILTSSETDTKISTTISNTGINTLSDISIANVVSDQVLQYNANTAKWENETLSLVSSVDGLTDTSLSNVQRDDYLKYDGSNWINSALDLSSYVTDTDIADYSNTAQMNIAIASSNTALKSYVDTNFSNTYNMGVAIASSNTAMKNYVDAEVAGVVNSAPSTLDTLNELAAALGDDPDFATTTATNIGTKLAKSSNLSDLTNAATARTNLGLGTAATTASTDYATSAQGTKADTAHGWGNHATAGYGTSSFSGAYADLTGKPSLFSGSYNDLSNKPTIPTNNNQLTNGAGYITSTVSGDIDIVGDVKAAGQIRATGWWNTNSSDRSGYAVEIGWSGGEGYLLSYSRTAGAYGAMNYSATSHDFSGGNVVIKSGKILNFESTSGVRGYIQATETNDQHLIIATTGGEDIAFKDGGVSGDSNLIVRGDGNIWVRGSILNGTMAYSQLTGTPTIPTNNNQLTNGAGYVTSSSLSGYVSRTFENSSRNLIIPTNSTSASGGIALETSNGAWLFQLYGTGTSYGFLQSQWGAWDIQKAVNGQMQLRISGTDYTVYHTGNLPTIPTNNNQLTNGAGYTTFSANQSLNTNSGPTFQNVYVNDWFRNNAASEGLYNQATGQHFYSASAAYWHINSSNGLIFYSAYNASSGNATNRKGYVYFDSSGFGLLHSGGGWAVRTTSSDTELYNTVKLNSISEAPSEWNPVLLEDGGIIKKDSGVTIHGAGYLQAAYLNMSHGATTRSADTVFYSSTDSYIRKNNKAGMQSSLGIGAGCGYLDISGANYGTVKVDDDRGVTWAGYTIRDDWSLMSDGASNFGIYNDTDNEWSVLCRRNADTEIMHNGTARLETTSGGVLINGTIDCTSQFAYTARNYGHGIFGVYSSTRYQHVWSMGTAYKTNDTGTSYGNMYGLTYTHTNVGTGTNQSISGLSHQLQHRTNGTLTAAIGSGIWTSGNVTAYSDIAVKENIVKIDNAIDKVKQINGYTYDRIDIKKQNEDLGEDIPTRQAGVIAQEIEKVLPEVVSGDDGNKAVAYGNVVALLIEAIKEQQQQIEELKEIIDGSHI